MKRLANRFVAIVMCMTVVQGLTFALDKPTSVTQEPTQQEKLWRGLIKIWPYKQKPIDLYCENESMTQICFRSGGQTYIYSLETAKAERVVHAKVIPSQINRITYEKLGTGASFVLWYYGNRELEIGAR